jgi:hypothetical protein
MSSYQIGSGHLINDDGVTTGISLTITPNRDETTLIMTVPQAEQLAALILCEIAKTGEQWSTGYAPNAEGSPSKTLTPPSTVSTSPNIRPGKL